MKDLRNLGDEVAKEVATRGGDMSLVSNEKRGFEELMMLVMRIRFIYYRGGRVGVGVMC